MNPPAERAKYVFAVILYGTIGLFLRYVSIPSEIVAMCRGLIGGTFILVYLKARGQRLDRAAILQTAKAEPGLEEAIGIALESYGLLLRKDWVFLYEYEKIRAHLPDALAEDAGFWLSVLRSHPDLAEGCQWEKLDGRDWRNLLGLQPQFADRCPWEKLSVWLRTRLLPPVRTIPPINYNTLTWVTLHSDWPIQH